MGDSLMDHSPLDDMVTGDMCWAPASASSAISATPQPQHIGYQQDPFTQLPIHISSRWIEHAVEVQISSYNCTPEQMSQRLALPAYPRLAPAMWNMRQVPQEPPIRKTVMYTKEQWDEKKDIIHQLWMVEDRPWESSKDRHDSVEYILRTQHNLKVTKRQFLKQTKAWGFLKNIKSKEMVAIDALERKREVKLGKRTEFDVRGRKLPAQKLERWRRKNIGEKIIAANEPTETNIGPVEADLMDMDISYSTPKEPDDPMRNIAPRPEDILSSIPVLNFVDWKTDAFSNHGNSGSLSLSVTDLDIPGSPKLSRLLSALRLKAYEEITPLSLSLDNEEDAVMVTEDLADVSQSTEGSSSQHQNRLVTVISSPPTALSPFYNPPAFIRVRRKTAWETLASYKEEEVRCKTAILHLAATNAPLADRLPWITKLANSLYNHRDFSASGKLYRHVAIQSAKIFGKTDTRTIEAYHDVLDFLSAQDQSLLTAKINERFQTTAIKVIGFNHTLSASVLEIDARISSYLGRDDEAERKYRHVIQVLLTNGGLADKRLWDIFIRFALALMQKEKYQECEEILLLLFDLGSAGVLRPPFYNELIGFLILAVIYLTQYRFIEGMKLFQDIVSKTSETFWREFPEQLDMIKEFADAFYDEGQYEQAREISKAGCDLCQIGSDIPDPLYLHFLTVIAKTHYATGNYEEAVHFYLQLVELEENRYGTHHSETLKSSHILGKAYYKLQKYEESLKWFHKIHTDYKTTSVSAIAGITEVFFYLGRTYYKLQAYPESLNWLQKANAEVETAGDLEDLTAIDVCWYLGRVCYRLKAYPESLYWLQKAKNGYQSLGLKHAGFVEDCQERIDIVLEESKNTRR